MLNSSALKIYAIKSGKSIKEVRESYKETIKTAEEMNKLDDIEFIKETLNTLLEINDEKTTMDIATRFEKSGHKNFGEFLKEITSGGTGSGNIQVSSDLPQELRPEQPVKKDDEEEEKKKLKISKITPKESFFKKKKISEIK